MNFSKKMEPLTAASPAILPIESDPLQNQLHMVFLEGGAIILYIVTQAPSFHVSDFHPGCIRA